MAFDDPYTITIVDDESDPSEQRFITFGGAMKDRYDFKGKRGTVVQPEPEPEGKIRITIRLDQDIVDRFF